LYVTTTVGTTLKNKENSFSFCLLCAWFLHGLLFSPEDGGNMFLQNLVRLSVDYMKLNSR
jgi:hypothetical protein